MWTTSGSTSGGAAIARRSHDTDTTGLTTFSIGSRTPLERNDLPGGRGCPPRLTNSADYTGATA